MTKAVLLAVAAILTASAAQAEHYPLNHPADSPTGSTHTRWVNAVSLATDSASLTVAIPQGENRELYQDELSRACFAALPGQSVTPAVAYSGDWMHGYLYIDYDRDGQFSAPDSAGSGELVSYSYLDGKNSAGQTVAQNTIAMPSFVIPEGTPPGIYRARFVIDWDAADPGGSAEIAAFGGAIVDLCLYVTDSFSPASVTATSNTDEIKLLGSDLTRIPASWPAMQCLPVNAVTRPDMHIEAVTVTASVNDPEAEALGNPTGWTATLGPDDFFLGNGVIPSALMLPMSVEIHATAAAGKAELPYAAEGYHLVWNDEFNSPDGTHPSHDFYETPERYNSAWNRFISSRPDLMVMRDGILMMYCKPNPEADRTEADDREMVSGAIRTRNHFSFRHGRVEARMKVHGFRGSFPAFWLMPDNQPQGWPVSGEIDIFESINNQNTAFATLHAGRQANNDVITHLYQKTCNINQWHVYGLEWDENSLKGYLDGELMGTVTKETINQRLWPFNEQEFYIILNQSVGNGSWAANPDLNHTYVTEVDWVRVYQRDGQSATGALTYPTDLWEQVTGIESVPAENGSLSARLFDMQGRPVSPATATPGLYISRRGTVTEKIVIR